jgi:hypothetical protein
MKAAQLEIKMVLLLLIVGVILATASLAVWADRRRDLRWRREQRDLDLRRDRDA